MHEDKDAFRRILAATSIVGGATAITILIGVARMKIFALVIGPVGIGLMGVLASIMAVGATVGGMGLGTSGVRQIAASEATRAVARRALWFATWPMALVAGLALWFARTEIARLVTGNTDHALAVGLTGVGVVLTIAVASQWAVIQGFQRIGDLSKARILGALLSLLIGVPAVVYGGPLGIVAAVIALPLGNVLAALPFRPKREPASNRMPHALRAQWRPLFTVGAVVMISSSLGALSLVLIRAVIIDRQGLQAAGLYQAAYAISAMNVSLVLTAMAADYFPRLSAIEGDRQATNQLVNQQLRAAILLGAPILAALVALAPLVLQLFYSSAFAPAAAMLRWQVAGELLKFPGWALGFLLVARRDTGRFLLTELMFVAVYLGGTMLLLPLIGLAGAGLAYLGAYLVYSVTMFALCGRRHGVRLNAQNIRDIALVLIALVAITMLSAWSQWAAAIVGLLFAAGLAIRAVRQLDQATQILARFRGRGRSSAVPIPPILEEGPL